MHVAIIGAGVTGVTAAYYLSCLGHRVTLVERDDAVASATSFANGAQLSYSFADPMAKPQLLKTLPGILLGRDPAMRVALTPTLVSWGLKFVAQCTSGRAQNNLKAALDLTTRSQRLLDQLLEQIPIDMHKKVAGKLVLLASQKTAMQAESACEIKQHYGLKVRVVDRVEACEIEPALNTITSPFVAAVYAPNDTVADAHQFSVQLGKWLRANREVEFKMNTTAMSFMVKHGAIAGVRTKQGDIKADAVVLSAGTWSIPLARSMGHSLDIYPLRGYSVTLPAVSSSPRVSITDTKHRLVFTHLDNQMRIAGFADFVSLNTRQDPDRLTTLLRTAERVAPHAADYRAIETHSWGGFRPMTPNSLPITGHTSTPGLFLNTGHGMLGWTMACATGFDVAQEVDRSQHC